MTGWAEIGTVGDGFGQFRPADSELSSYPMRLTG